MAKEFTTIKVDKDVADAVWLYSKLHNTTGREFVSDLLRDKLADLIKHLEGLKENAS